MAAFFQQPESSVQIGKGGVATLMAGASPTIDLQGLAFDVNLSVRKLSSAWTSVTSRLTPVVSRKEQ